jgi:uncharacterized membrane protein
MKASAWALWYGVAVFAMGGIGYFFLTVEAGALPAWVTLGGAAFMGLCVALHSFYTELH